jgi:hypothetical protein
MGIACVLFGQDLFSGQDSFGDRQRRLLQTVPARERQFKDSYSLIGRIVLNQAVWSESR